MREDGAGGGVDLAAIRARLAAQLAEWEERVVSFYLEGGCNRDYTEREVAREKAEMLANVEGLLAEVERLREEMVERLGAKDLIIGCVDQRAATQEAEITALRAPTRSGGPTWRPSRPSQRWGRSARTRA